MLPSSPGMWSGEPDHIHNKRSSMDDLFGREASFHLCDRLPGLCIEDQMKK